MRFRIALSYFSVIRQIPPIISTQRKNTYSRPHAEILEKARTARNGSGEKFTRLYDQGDWSGYPSQSEADQALCALLAFWADGDVSTIDALFRQSGLYRDKWERDDYREDTISRAIELRRAS